MRYMPIAKIVAGMVLGQEILDGEGKALLEKGTLLGQEETQRLLGLGVSGIYIEDGFSSGVEARGLISPALCQEALRLVHDLFQEEKFREVGQDDIIDLARRIAEELIAGKEMLYDRMDVRAADDYAYFHAVNVAVLSAMLGIQAGELDLEELTMLTAAGLVHDVGRRYVEQEVLNAKRALTEEERMLVVQHAKLSYDFLEEHYDFGPELLAGVLEHHEWYNGCGYPMRRSGQEISYFARILKIADVFDALTSRLPYHGPVSPSGAVDYILANTGVEFDPDLAELFVKKIAIYPVGCQVALSDGREALVLENSPDSLLRPKIKAAPEGEVVDLQSEAAKDLAVLELLV